MGKTLKDLKQDGKVTLDGPKVKDRKVFARPSQKHKRKKGKGSYERKKGVEENQEKKDCWKGYKKDGTKKKGGKTVNNCVPIVGESTSILKFLEAIMTDNHSDAHKYLKDSINKKIQTKISQEIENPLF
jgi:ribosomal protein S21